MHKEEKEKEKMSEIVVKHATFTHTPAQAHATRLSRVYRITVTKNGVQDAEYLPCEIGTEQWTPHRNTTLDISLSVDDISTVRAGAEDAGANDGNATPPRQQAHPIYRPVPTQDTWIGVCGENDRHCMECL